MRAAVGVYALSQDVISRHVMELVIHPLVCN
jgi:hypothetical protein